MKKFSPPKTPAKAPMPMAKMMSPTDKRRKGAVKTAKPMKMPKV